MKKNNRLKATAIVTIAASSIALTLHFYSLHSNLKEVNGSYEKLNVEYNRVLTENEELHSKVNTLQDAVNKSAGLLEQTQMEIERLTTENKDLIENAALNYEPGPNHQISSDTVQQTSLKTDDNSWESFRLTYYDNNYESTGKRPGDPGYGITKSGRKTKEGVTIAVDPNVIPLGTWVLIKWPDGTVEKRRADDTGSAIKGNDIDYYVPNATLDMGDETVQVKILDEE